MHGIFCKWITTGGEGNCGLIRFEVYEDEECLTFEMDEDMRSRWI
jgi:hypothetical protein